jgi:hypothetical protein
MGTVACESLQHKHGHQAEPEIYLQSINDKTDMILVENANGDQVIDALERFLKPRFYKEVPPPMTASSSSCQYIDANKATEPTPLGDCSDVVKPTCFRLIESIRQSILSAKEIEMTTHICVGTSKVAQAALLEIVYGSEEKWSGSNISVNAQKDFHELKEILASQLGNKIVHFVRATTASNAFR